MTPAFSDCRENFVGKDGQQYLVRCPSCKRENYAPAVSSGQCAWCWRELATLRERLAEAEQRAERAEQDAERMEAIEKHGLKIVTDFVIDSLVAGRTFGSVRELFDAAIAARSAT